MKKCRFILVLSLLLSLIALFDLTNANEVLKCKGESGYCTKGNWRIYNCTTRFCGGAWFEILYTCPDCLDDSN